MIGAGAVATVVVLVVGIHYYFALEPRLDAPGIVAASCIGIIGGAAFVLLMIVMRGLLKTATALRVELDEVV